MRWNEIWIERIEERNYLYVRKSGKESGNWKNGSMETMVWKYGKRKWENINKIGTLENIRKIGSMGNVKDM